MMRLILGLTALTLLWFSASNTGAQPKKPAKAVGQAQAPAGWPREAKGYGQTEEDAHRHAVKDAVDRVRAFLKRQDPPLDAWQPDEAYVAEHLLKGEGHAGQDVKLNVGIVKEWVQPLRDPNWSELVQLNQRAQRQVLSAERQAQAGYSLAILTALFATGWGYLRLDEWTLGRMSKGLALGAAAISAILALAWWTGM